MGFFGWFFVIVIGLIFTRRIWGPRLLKWIVKRVQQRFMREMKSQADAYDRSYQNPDGRKQQRVDRDLTVEYKDEVAKPKEPEWNQLAEDVDFEEVK
jgi:Sec-independent protein translocase protein TatA